MVYIGGMQDFYIDCLHCDTSFLIHEYAEDEYYATINNILNVNVTKDPDDPYGEMHYFVCPNCNKKIYLSIPN